MGCAAMTGSAAASIRISSACSVSEVATTATTLPARTTSSIRLHHRPGRSDSMAAAADSPSFTG